MLPKSHRKIQNDGNHPNPHTVIQNTFGTQGTKIIQGNIMCESNFHMYMFGNVLKFWCYDPTFILLAKADSVVFPSYITFWLTVTQSLQSFFLLAIGNKPLSLRSCLEAQNTFFVIQVFPFFFFFFFNFHRGRKRGKIDMVFVAMDHRNLHYHMALQAVH